MLAVQPPISASGKKRKGNKIKGEKVGFNLSHLFQNINIQKKRHLNFNFYKSILSPFI